ncbi:MAG: hypothetical protein ACJ71G_18385 [Nitrososphaeraceae archaeon]
MSYRIKCNNKGSMGYSTKHRRQKRKIHALSLAKECYSMKLDLLTNATVVDDAIRFVSQKSKDKANIKSAVEDDKEESREPDYNEDEDQLEEEQTKEITSNEVF